MPYSHKNSRRLTTGKYVKQGTLISPMHQTCIRVLKADASVKSTGE